MGRTALLPYQGSLSLSVSIQHAPVAGNVFWAVISACVSRLDLKISEIYGVSLSDTGSMRSSKAGARPALPLASASNPR